MANLERPYFPKRAVVTGGMPYGDKNLHSGHIGGLFVHADIYARFLRDRIGKENVIYVCGADCYGSGTELKYEEAKKSGGNVFAMTIEGQKACAVVVPGENDTLFVREILPFHLAEQGSEFLMKYFKADNVTYRTGGSEGIPFVSFAVHSENVKVETVDYFPFVLD